jgi:ribose transport system permease protein
MSTEVEDTKPAEPAPSHPLGATAPGRGRMSATREVASRFGVLWLLILLIVLFSVLEPDTFFTWSNFTTILSSQGVLLFLTLGLIIPLTVEEFDLSVGSMTGLSAVLIAKLTQDGMPFVPTLLIVLAAGCAVGLIHALFVVRIGVSSFIVTLGSGTVLAGLAVKVTGSQIISDVPQPLIDVTTARFLGIQLVFWFALSFATVIWYVMQHTPLGRWLYFVGSGRSVAKLNGIPVPQIRAGALVASAIAATGAGMLLAGSQGAGDPSVGTNYLLPAFAAVFLGGTAIHPGRFNAWGTVIAVYLVVVGIVGLTLTTGASGWIADVFNGGVLVLAVAASRLASPNPAADSGD